MKDFKVKSIRKPNKCPFCKGSGTLFAGHVINCSHCNGTGMTKFKLMIQYNKYTLEAHNLNNHNHNKSKFKWEVFVYIQENNLKIHQPALTGRGKSLDYAYHDAINKIKKQYFREQSGGQSAEEEVINPIDVDQ